MWAVLGGGAGVAQAPTAELGKVVQLRKLTFWLFEAFLFFAFFHF